MLALLVGRYGSREGILKERHLSKNPADDGGAIQCNGKNLVDDGGAVLWNHSDVDGRSLKWRLLSLRKFWDIVLGRINSIEYIQTEKDTGGSGVYKLNVNYM